MYQNLLSKTVYEDPLAVNLEESQSPQEEWRPLHLFNIYRLIVAGLLVTAYTTRLGPDYFGDYDTKLFLTVAVFYFIFAFFSGFASRFRRPGFTLQVMVQGLVDILAIGLLMYASGGTSSGLGMLLIMAIAGSSVLTEGRTAFFFAAVASLVVLVEEILTGLYGFVAQANYAQAGILGATFFATAFLAHALARRIRASDLLARQRGLHLQYLAHLNEQIVAHIQTGIMVVDRNCRVRLFNEAAQYLLGMDKDVKNGDMLREFQPGLEELLKQWQKQPSNKSHLFHTDSAEVDSLVSFIWLKRAGVMGTLITLEDATLTSQRAHQLKLASLGHLTASIAHEVRNPLGAISHAGQLLAESPDLSAADKRLIEIIVSQGKRVNTIVENVLQLSRQREPATQNMELGHWLDSFVNELREVFELPPEAVQTHNDFKEIPICFDPGQLRQVLWNLCENALRYSQGTPLLELRSGVTQESGRFYLDIQDHGTGIDQELIGRVFEPFFTGETNGTGLGLYLARGFCDSNRASLHIISNSGEGCCFRIVFHSPVKV